MNKATVARLAKLEGVKGDQVRLGCIIRRIIEADGTEIEPQRYRDRRGNVWMREPGESFEAFRERAEAGAMAACLPGGCAVIMPHEGEWVMKAARNGNRRYCESPSGEPDGDACAG